MSDKPEHVGVDSKSAVERDRIDLNHEIAGEPTGRIPRFLTENHYALYGGDSEKKQSEHRYRTMLQMLLEDDARYARLYYEVQDTLNKARRAADRALDDITRQLEEAEKTLQHMCNNAARLDDGTLVFRSTVDGHVYTEGGRQLSDDEAQDIEFSENAPIREDYNTQKKKVETLKEQEVEVKTYKRDVIDRAQERIREVNDPPILEELNDLKERIEQTMPDTVKARYDTSSPAAQRNIRSASIYQNIQENKPDFSVPDMNAAFDKAHDDISNKTGDVPASQPGLALSF
ncbi:MAG: hypothetical protein KDF59_06150 [Nitrosomonas sp.]|nr:hypothetical protein [Nitrosomonas sp.]